MLFLVPFLEVETALRVGFTFKAEYQSGRQAEINLRLAEWSVRRVIRTGFIPDPFADQAGAEFRLLRPLSG